VYLAGGSALIAAACGGGSAVTDRAGLAHPSAGRSGMAVSAAGAGFGGTASNAGTAGAVTSTGGASATAGSAGAFSAGLGGSAGAIAAGGSGGMSGGAGGVPASGAGSAGTGNGAGAGSTGTLALSGLTIDPNPNMTISCFVSWTTAEAADSEVDFGESTYTFRLRDATPTMQHRVLVIGMHAQTAYKIKAVSSTAAATGSLEGTFTTGMLPADLPIPMLTASDFADSQTGWTLTNIQGSTSAPALIVMYDQNGVPVWYFVNGTHGDSRGDVDTKLLTNSVLVGPTSGEPAREVDLSGKELWEGPAQSNQELMTHYLGKTSTGDYLLNYELDKAVTNGTTKIDDQRLEEITPSLDVVWSWKLFDHIPPAGNREELCHGNALIDDETGGMMYYNCRFLGLFKIERSSGNILWRLGGTYDTTSIGPGDFTFDPPAAQFSDDHAPELHDDGTIILYDNGGYAEGGGFSGGQGSQNYHSRVVEYQVDQTTMTATRTWEFPGTFDVDTWYKNSWYSAFWGSAQRLDNTNILITAPTKSATASTRIFEVTRAGKVVWELTMPVNYGSFKAHRYAPLAEAIQ
jgi:Arylsulfotransferase (ASST)